MKAIAIASLKGGAGKTALAIFLALSLKARGMRTLAVDLDHNNNLSDYFLRSADTASIEARNAYHALSGSLAVNDCIHETPSGVDCLPATVSLGRVSLELARDPGSLLRFSPALKRAGYDMVVIDTPPSLCLEMSAGLYAASLVLSPVGFTRWTAQGFAILSEELQRVQSTLLREIPMCAIAANLSAAECAKLNQSHALPLAPVAILKSAAIRRACDRGLALAPNSKSARQFDELADYVLERLR